VNISDEFECAFGVVGKDVDRIEWNLFGKI
jgi:hypothetical protein